MRLPLLAKFLAKLSNISTPSPQTPLTVPPTQERSLGRQLLLNTEAARTLARTAQQQRQTLRVQRENQVATEFFEHAKNYFTLNIKEGTPCANLFLQVGGKGEFAALLRASGAHDPGLGRPPQPLALSQNLQFHWTQFQQWATENELIAYWQGVPRSPADMANDDYRDTSSPEKSLDASYKAWRLRVKPDTLP